MVSNLLVIIRLCFLLVLPVIPTVFGCGQLPQGQIVFMRFTVEGTSLPAQMAYSGSSAVQALVSSINRDEQMARTAVERQIMTAVEDVLEQEDHSALLPDFLISQILQQLNVSIHYTPINCVYALVDLTATPAGYMKNMPEACFVIGGFVTRLCVVTTDCDHAMPTHVMQVPSKYMRFTGEFRTSNTIMANWSRQMKESVMGRVRRRLASTQTPFGMFFSSATITLNS